MADQAFTAAEREAIWLAWSKKCGYTRDPLDVSEFHIDHIVPEHLADDPAAFSQTKAELSLPADFDVRGYGNLLPCRARANLQKGGLTFDANRINFFLGVAAGKVSSIHRHLSEITRRNNRGKAIILLQQCLERNELSADEVLKLLESHSDKPEEIFSLLLNLKFADEDEVNAVARAGISELLDRPIWIGSGGDQEGLELPDGKGSTITVRTCNEYKAALAAGYFAASTYEIKMASWFEQQYGLLSNLQAAKSPVVSFVSNPLRGVIDLELLPYELFPRSGEPEEAPKAGETYQSKVDDGTLVVRKAGQGKLRIESVHGLGQQLIEVTRADFNGFGFEEILVFDSFYAIGGSMGAGGVSILSRTSADSLFEYRHSADA